MILVTSPLLSLPTYVYVVIRVYMYPPPYKGQFQCPQGVLYSEVPLYIGELIAIDTVDNDFAG